MFDEWLQNLICHLFVAGQSGQTSLLGPPAIAIRDYCNMLRNIFHFYEYHGYQECHGYHVFISRDTRGTCATCPSLILLPVLFSLLLHPMQPGMKDIYISWQGP